MAARYSESSRRGRQTGKGVEPVSDREIDYPGLPAFSRRQLEAMKKLGRSLIGSAPRKLIAVRIDPFVLSEIRKEAKRKKAKWQSLSNAVLAKHVESEAA